MSQNRLEIEVAYALPEAQTVIALRVPAGTRVGEAIALSGIVTRHPEIDLSRNRVGIFGRRVTSNDGVADGDRIEIYRPLVADPKDSRRERVSRRRDAGDKPRNFRA